MKKVMISLFMAAVMIAGSISPVAAHAAETVEQMNTFSEDESPQEDADAAPLPSDSRNEDDLTEDKVKVEETEEEAGEEISETSGETLQDASVEPIAGEEPETIQENIEENGQGSSVEILPDPAPTTENEEDEPVYTGVIEATEESVLPEGAGAESSEEMFSRYVDRSFSGGAVSARKRLRAAAHSSLSGYDLAVYGFLASEISKIASGELSSTIITITPEIMGLEQTSWTAEELGVDSIWELDENGKIVKNESGRGVLNPLAVANVRAKAAVNHSKIIDALLADHPYELYWYQKTSGTQTVSFAFITDYDSSTRTYSLNISSNMQFKFPVTDEYALSRYEMDTSIGQAVQESVRNAKDIVAKYSRYEDLEKLRGYKDEICRLVSYNYGAASGGEEYGNPWQMIWVFDGDPGTRVVCEGYAKAFKYLCDQTVFDGDISCILTSGTMVEPRSSSKHMWNVVKMEDGNNYLVDVTNCDSKPGDTDRLFLVGTQEKRENTDGLSGYYFDSAALAYYYDVDTEEIFSDADLELFPHNYGAHVWMAEYTTDEEATCTEEGSESIHCSICGAADADSIRSIPIRPHELGEWCVTLAPGCLTEGKRERTCRNCEYMEEETVEAAGHVWEKEFTVDQKPTKTSTGIKSKHCENCGEIDILSIQIIPALKGQWRRDNAGWWYQWDDGSYSCDVFEQIDGRVYRFNRSGYMLTGWQKIDGAWYYFDGSGAMRTGWQKIGGYWYYLNESGAMQTGWQKIGGVWYYLNGSGAMRTGWQKIGGYWYYLNGSGAMQTGWQRIGGYWYYLSESGAMRTGWQKIGGYWYYLSGSGAMQTGWQKIGGKWYYFVGSGEMVTGSRYIDGKWYYFDENGAMK